MLGQVRLLVILALLMVLLVFAWAVGAVIAAYRIAVGAAARGNITVDELVSSSSIPGVVMPFIAVATAVLTIMFAVTIAAAIRRRRESGLEA